MSNKNYLSSKLKLLIVSLMTYSGVIQGYMMENKIAAANEILVFNL